MKRRTRLALSALSGIAAAAIVLLALGSAQDEAARARQEAAERYGGELVTVCVASRDIEPGETIDEGDARAEEWVATLLPDGALTSLREVLGKTATSRIPAHAPLSTTYFEREADGFSVPDGTVAVAVASDAEHAVGGALDRGDRVDVYVSRDSLADRLCAAEILDTSALADGGGDITWVTLAVDAARVSELLAATSQGAVYLVAPGASAGDGDGGDAS